MLGVIFGTVVLICGLVVRERAIEEEYMGLEDSAAMSSIIAVGCVLIGSIFIVVGFAGW